MKLSFVPVVLTCLIATAAAIPAAPKAKASSTKPAAAPKSTGTAGSGTGAAAAAAPCSSQVMALAQGISDNIADQRNELSAVTAVGDMLSETPVDQVTFAAAKASLLTYVNKGISIRQNNQKIAPAGNPALAGLATVAMAQMAEFNLTNSLTGNPAVDNATVTTLKKDFNGGIMQNMKNLAAATSNCTAPAKIKF